MNKFDKMIKELSRNVNVPEGFSERVEDVLESLPEDEDKGHTRNNRRWLEIAACVVCVVGILTFSSVQAKADIFETFRQTIMDFLHLSANPQTGENKGQDLGVESNNMKVESRQDLMLEMQEVVVNAQGIYLLVQITAPPEIELTEDITFDYFAVCEGENYNADNLIGSGKQCSFLENIEGKPNVASYVMTLSSDMEPYMGSMVVACFKDLTLDPYGENPQLLVEGMWSIPFLAERTVRDGIEIEGDEDMVFPLAKTTAAVKHINLTPLGITLVSDVSGVPNEELGVTDTTITLQLQMLDGSNISIRSDNSGQDWIVEGSNSEYSNENGRTYQKDSYSFSTAIDLQRVAGVYVQGIYIPIEY